MRSFIIYTFHQKLLGLSKSGEQVTRMGEMTNDQIISVGKPERERPLVRDLEVDRRKILN
jgi:hypothetical protein